MNIVPRKIFQVNVSFKNKREIIITKTTLNLSTGATLDAGPS